MSTKEEAKKVLLNVRVDQTLHRAIKFYNIDISNTCRDAIKKEIEKLRKKKIKL